MLNIKFLIPIIIVIIALFTLGWLFITGNFYYPDKSTMKIQRKQLYPSLSGGSGRIVKPASVSPDSNGLIIPPKFPQVGVFTLKLLYNSQLSDYVWLEKTDGLHSNLIIKNGSVYSIVFGKSQKLDDIKLTDAYEKQTILDTELYEGKYYIFDCPMVDDTDISTKTFIERMNSAAAFLKLHPELARHFTLKPFSQVDENSFPKIIDMINETNISPTTHNHIDGVVFQLINAPYYSNDYITFKLKRSVLNTIDFKLHYSKDEKIFYLYLIGDFKHVIYNNKRLPHSDVRTVDTFEPIDTFKTQRLPSSCYVLFSSPFFENLHVFCPDIITFNNECKRFYFDDEIKQISSLLTSIVKNPSSYDGKIVELSLCQLNRFDNIWLPMRVREDKNKSNSYDVGLSNVSVMFNPITKDSIKDSNLYFTKSKELAFDKTTIDAYHSIAKLIRQFIIEHTINERFTRFMNRGDFLNVLDLAGGRGADELLLYHCGAINIFAQDADRMALFQYVDRTKWTPTMKDFKFLLPSSVEPPDLKKNIYINAVQGFLEINNDDILDDITERKEYPPNGFHVVLMNYAFHYLCDNIEKVKALEKFVASVLRQNGLFIFSFFDGDAIREIMKTGGKIGPFVIKASKHDITQPKCLKLKKRITSSSSLASAVKLAHMPLPTIDSTGYRDEPLVLKEHLDVVLNSPHFEIVETFHPLKLVQRLKEYASIEDPDNVSEFLQHITVCVLKRTKVPV